VHQLERRIRSPDRGQLLAYVVFNGLDVVIDARLRWLRYAATARRSTADRPSFRTSSVASSFSRSLSSTMICIAFMLIVYVESGLRSTSSDA